MNGIIKAIHNAKSVKPVILLSYGNQGCKNENFKETLQFYCRMIKDVPNNLQHFFFAFSKLDEKEDLKKVHADLKNLLSCLDKKDKDNEFESMLQQIIAKIEISLEGSFKLARIVRPLDNNPIKFIQELMKMEGIYNPKEVFLTTVLQAAFDRVGAQFEINANAIINALKLQNADLAFFYFGQLVKYTNTFPDYPKYENRLSSLLEEIRKFFDKKYEEGMQNISSSFNKEDQINKQDVNKFYQAFKQAKILDSFVEKSSKILEQHKTKSWKRYKDYTSNVENLCSFSNFIQENKDLEIFSKKWNQYTQALDAIIEFLSDKNDKEIRDLIDNLNDQFQSAEQLFNIKIQELCKQSTKDLIQMNILDLNEQELKVQKDKIKQILSNFIENVKKAQQVQAQNKLLSKKLSEAIVNFLNELCIIFNELKQRELKVLVQGIERMKKSQLKQQLVVQDLNYQVVSFPPSLIDQTQQFLDIFQDIDDTLSIQVNYDYLIDFKKIGGDLIKDIEKLYEQNEKKIYNLIINPNTKFLNIENTFEQIITLRKIPYIKEKTAISYESIKSKIKEIFERYRSKIEKLICELENFIIKRIDNVEFLAYVEQLIKTTQRLQRILKISDEFQNFYDKVVADIKKQIDDLKKNIEEKIKSYNKKSYDNIEKFKRINQMIQQLSKLQELAILIKYEQFNKDNKNYLEMKGQHLTLLKDINQYITTKESKSDGNQFIQSNECIEIQQKYQYLEECSRNDFILQTLNLNENVKESSQKLNLFIDNNIKLMKKEIEKFCKLIKRLSEMDSLNIGMYNKIINDIGSFQIDEKKGASLILYHMQEILNKKAFLIRCIFITLKIIYDKKYFEQYDSYILEEQKELLKEQIDEIIDKFNEKKFGEIKFEINSSIIGKLIPLDNIIYPEIKKINQTYEQSFQTMQKVQNQSVQKVTLALKEQEINYDSIRVHIDQLSQFQSNKESEKEICRLIRKRVQDLCDCLKTAIFNLQDQDYDKQPFLKDIKKIILEVLQIRKILQKKYLKTDYDQIKTDIFLFITKFKENLEQFVGSGNTDGILKGLLRQEQYHQYYKQISYWKNGCKIIIQNDNKDIYLRDLAPQEESKKSQEQQNLTIEVNLEQELDSIIKLNKKLIETLKITQDPIEKIMIQYTISIENQLNCDDFEKMKPQEKIQKLKQIDEKDLSKEQQKQLKENLDQIHKYINYVYEYHINQVKPTIQSSMFNDKVFNQIISRIEKSFKYIPEECKSNAQKSVNSLKDLLEQQKKESQKQMNKNIQSCKNNFVQILYIYEQNPEAVNQDLVITINQQSNEFVKEAINLIDSHDLKDFNDLLENKLKLLSPIEKIDQLLKAKHQMELSQETIQLYIQLKGKIIKRFNSLIQQINESWRKDLNMDANIGMKNEVTLFKDCTLNIDELKIFLNFRLNERKLSEGFIPNFDQNISTLLNKINAVIQPLLQDFDDQVANEENFSNIIKLIQFIDQNKVLIQTYQNDEVLSLKIIELFSKNKETASIFIENLKKLNIKIFIKSFYDLHIKMKVEGLQGNIQKFFKEQKDLNNVINYFVTLQKIEGIDYLINKECGQNVKDIREKKMDDFLKQWEQKVQEVYHDSIQLKENFDKIFNDPKTFDEILQENKMFDQIKQDQLFFDKIKQNYKFIMEILHNVEKSKIVWIEGSNTKLLFDRIKEMNGQIDKQPNELMTSNQKLWEIIQQGLTNRKLEFIVATSYALVFAQNLKNTFSLKEKQQECQILIDTIIIQVGKIVLNNGQNAIINLKQYLNKVPIIGQTILYTQPIFQGFQNEKVNETLQKTPLKDIIKQTYGNLAPCKVQKKNNKIDSNIDQKTLENLCEIFFSTYDIKIKNFLDVKHLPNKESLIQDLKKQTISTIDKDKLIELKQRDNVINMLVNIFSAWTLLNADTFYQTQGNLDFQKCYKYLLRPHIGQVIALLRMFGLAYTKVNQEKQEYSEIRKNQFKHFKKETFFNNIVLMKQGEGKTLVIAIASIIFALWGFEVNCCQQTFYLCKYNYDKYQELFQKFGVENLIQYRTLKQVCEKELDITYGSKNGIRLKDKYLSKILNEGYMEKAGKFFKKIFGPWGGSNDKRKSVLLFEEVSSLLDENIFGQIYKPKVTIEGEWVENLFEFIWKHRDEFIEIQNNGILKVQYQQRFQDGVLNFRNEFKDLYIQALKQIFFDLDQLKLYEYKVHNSIVHFKQQGQWISDDKFQYGYLTIFAYYDAYDKGQIGKYILKGKARLFFQCGKFCYTQIIRQFGLIIGASCTLENLIKQEKKILESYYDIHNFTQIPPIFDQKQLDWKNFDRRIQISEEFEYFGNIIYQIRHAFSSSAEKQQQPSLIVFKDLKRIQKFFEKHKENNMQIIDQSQTLKEIHEKIQQASQSGQITLITSNIIQGIDFKCSEFSQQGFHVVQTFFSSDKSEYLSIRGRTARLGKKGSYRMILNKKELEDDFGFGERFKDEYNQKVNVHKYLKHLRETSLNNKYQYIAETLLMNSKFHQQSMQQLLKLKMKVKEQKAKFTEICQYLSNINESPKKNYKVFRTLIMLEATESMKEYNIPGLLKIYIPQIMDENPGKKLQQFKVAIYRNYNCTKQTIFQSMSQWTNKIEDIQKFLSQVENKSMHIEKLGEVFIKDKAAIEIGTYFALEEINALYENKLQYCQISQIVIIGKNPHYSQLELDSIYNEKYKCKWLKHCLNEDYLNFKVLKTDLLKINNMKIPLTMIPVQNIAKEEFEAILREYPLSKVEQCQNPQKDIPEILKKLIKDCLSGALLKRTKPIELPPKIIMEEQKDGKSQQINQKPQPINDHQPADLEMPDQQVNVNQIIEQPERKQRNKERNMDEEMKDEEEKQQANDSSQNHQSKQAEDVEMNDVNNQDDDKNKSQEQKKDLGDNQNQGQNQDKDIQPSEEQNK